jgi:hypothetical protein
MDTGADMTTLTITFALALRKIRNKFIKKTREWRVLRSTVQDKRLLSCLLEGDGVLSPYTLDLWLKIESRNLPRHEVCKQRDKLIPYMPSGSVVSTDNGVSLQVEKQTLKNGCEIILVRLNHKENPQISWRPLSILSVIEFCHRRLHCAVLRLYLYNSGWKVVAFISKTVQPFKDRNCGKATNVAVVAKKKIKDKLHYVHTT